MIEHFKVIPDDTLSSNVIIIGKKLCEVIDVVNCLEGKLHQLNTTKSIEKEENCRNCKYGGIQICRRYPPDDNGRFKTILEDWCTWCGEYRSKKTQRQKEQEQ